MQTQTHIHLAKASFVLTYSKIIYITGGYGYPALIAVNPSKKAYAPLKAGFQQEAVRSFIESLRRGFEKVTPVRGELGGVKTIKPWDGKDVE